jgi:hypothetical protein
MNVLCFHISTTPDWHYPKVVAAVSKYYSNLVKEYLLREKVNEWREREFAARTPLCLQHSRTSPIWTLYRMFQTHTDKIEWGVLHNKSNKKVQKVMCPETLPS